MGIQGLKNWKMLGWAFQAHKRKNIDRPSTTYNTF